MNTETQEQIPFHVAVFEDNELPPERKLELLKMCLDHYLIRADGAEKAVSIMRGALSVVEGACKTEDPERFDTILHNDIPMICGVALRATELVYTFELYARQHEARKQAQEPPSDGTPSPL
jgi:hypothetical protein